MEQTRQTRLIGGMAALLAIAAILWTLLAAPSVGTIADGSYPSLTEALALRYKGDSFPIGERVEAYDYEDTAYSTLLLASRNSVGAVVALVRLVTHPFGIEFNTRYLAVVYALLIAWGVYLMTSGLARRSRTAAILAATMIPLLLSNSSIIGYLNSLYSVGAAIAYFMLFIGATVSCFCRGKGCGIHHALLVLFAAQLMLRTMAQMMVFLPATVITVVFAAIHTCPGKAVRPLHTVCIGIIGLMCLSGLVSGWQADDTVHSADANYLAVFQGYLPASDNPEEMLEALGLPGSYLADVGKSYYDPVDTFVNNPHDAQNAALLAEKISLSQRLAFIAKRPELVGKMLEEQQSLLEGTNNWYIINEVGETNANSNIVWAMIETAFGRNAHSMTVKLCISAVLMIVMLLFVREERQMILLCLLLSFVQVSAIFILPADLLITGGNYLITIKAVYYLIGWLSAIAIVISAVVLANALMNWLRALDSHFALQPIVAQPQRNVLLSAHKLQLHPNLLPWITGSICILMFFWQVLPADHVAGVNNGDFGRMMEQIDLYWMPEQLEDESTQEETYVYVIEKFDFREHFHPERLTPKDPTYSLLYPSMVVRLWSKLFHHDYYSTYVQSILLFLITSICLISISSSLQKLLGKMAYVCMAFILSIFFCETNVAWNNSLYGEATIPSALLAVIASALCLTTMPRAGRGKVTFLILLAISLRMLICSKAQLALAIPAAIIMMAVFTIYHIPKLKWKKILFSALSLFMTGLICFDAVMIYKKNQPVSEKQTIWQSVFYGLLMIVDYPEETMNELGIPLEMKADIGKHAYLPEDEYVYPVKSAEAEEKFYSHISTMKIVGYYITHPKYLMIMLNHAAEESIHLHTGFMEYTGKDYNPNCDLHRFNLWRNLRSCFAANSFYGYLLFYGVLVCYCIQIFLKKRNSNQKKLCAMIFLCIMMIGVFQYPLTVLGNGFADNNKQLFTFMLCHDLTNVIAITYALVKCIRYMLNDKEVRFK